MMTLVNLTRQVFLCGLLITLGWSQCWGQKPDVTIPAPEAAAIARYGETPVSYYTGVPSISIPLHTLQLGSLSIPLSLNYHAGGFKVEDEAGWCGLGFSLNVEYSISRSIRGKDDFGDGSGFGYRTYPGVPRCQDKVGGTFNCVSGGSFYSSLFLPTYQEAYNYNDYLFKVYDPADPNATADYYLALGTDRDWQSDLYYYSAGGVSGKFILDSLTQPQLLEQGNTRIQGGLAGWVITTEDGYQYTFDSRQRNVTYTSGSSSSSSAFISTWYLTSIRSPAGEEMTFEYDTSTSTYIKTYPNYSQNYLEMIYDGGDCGEPNQIPDISQHLYELHYLKKISYPNGYVVFERAPEARLDLEGGQSLQAIRIYQTSNGQETLLKSYELNTSYFGDQPNYGTARLRLDNLVEKGREGGSLPPYVFTYSTKKLPVKDSKARDYFGYYNGRTSNAELLPPFEGMINTGLLALGEKAVSYAGADREPDAAYIGGCLLEKVTYPTGGYTTYQYEANDYSNLPANTRQKVAKSVTFRRLTPAEPTYVNTGPVALNIDGQSRLVKFSFSLSCSDCVGTELQLALTGPDNYVRYWNWASFFEGEPPFRSGIELLNLAPGTYTFQLLNPAEESPDRTVQVYMTWQEEGAELLKRTGPGVRIRQITDADGLGDPDRVRVFRYDQEAHAGRSEGKLMVEPRFVQQRVTQHLGVEPQGGAIGIITCSYLKRASGSNLPLSNAANGGVGYSKVRVLYGENGENGQSVFTFRNEPDPYAPSQDWPVHIPTISYLDNGSLERQIDYSRDGRKVREVLHTYNNDRKYWRESRGMVVESNRDITRTDGAAFPDEPGLSLIRYNLFIYANVQQWNRLVETRERTYDQSDVTNTRYVETSQTYHYSPVHKKVARTTTRQSDQTQLVTHLRYPQDYALNNATDSPAQALQAMQTQHILSPVVEKQVWVKSSATDSVLRSAELNVFKKLPSSDVVPEAILALTPAQPLAPTSFTPLRPEQGALVYDADYRGLVFFEQYDEVSNRQQARSADGIPLTYLWGYNRRYPIAEVRNATYAEVLAVLGQATIDELAGASPGTAAQVRDKLAPLRTDVRLKGVQVTTYTYEPLVGMTSQTGPDGKTLYYEYDELQRLKRVKDHQGNLVKHYEYHYKQSPSN